MIGLIRQSGGFTLVELIIALAILAMLTTLAVPSFNSAVEDNRVTGETNSFISELMYARSEAIKRSAFISLCASTDGQTCSGSTDWENGWIIFSDSTGTIGALDGSDELLRVHGQLTENITLNGGASFVRYSPYGVIGS